MKSKDNGISIAKITIFAHFLLMLRFNSVTIHAVAIDVVGFDTEHIGLIKTVHKFDMCEAVPLGKLDFLMSYIRKNI